MKRFILAALIVTLYTASAFSENPQSQERVFFLEGVRSGQLHGPFPFRSGSKLTLKTGTFRLDVLSAKGDFLLTDEKTGSVFGVYEMIAGRMIDVGYQLFTITRISTRLQPPPRMPTQPPAVPQPSSPRRQPQNQVVPQRTQPTHFAKKYNASTPYTISAIVDVQNEVAYNWSIDGRDGGSAKFVERKGATFLFQKGIFSASASILMDGNWEESVDDISGQFSNASLANGTGWNLGVNIDIPVFSDGYWSASVGGGIQYQRESFDLEYDRRIARITTPVSTNTVAAGSTNDVAPQTPIISMQFIQETEDASLDEIWLNLNARLEYSTPTWFIYAGIHAMPWRNTALDADITIEGQSFPLEFEQKDPLSGFAGVGMHLGKTRSYAEFQAGGINAIRIGLAFKF